MLSLFAFLLLFATPLQSANEHDRLGKDFEAKGQFEKAANEYERAIELSPYEESHYFEAAHAYLLEQRFDSAVTTLQRGCRVFDKSAQLTLALGVAYYGQRRFNDAAQAFLRTIAIDPEVQQPYVFLSKMLDQVTGLVPEINSRFEGWAAANPRSALAQFVYAKGVLAAGGDPAQAESLLRRSIALKGDQWESHYELGVLLEKRRNFKAAAAELERSIALNDRQADVHYHLSRVYDRMGEREKAAGERDIHERLIASIGVK